MLGANATIWFQQQLKRWNVWFSLLTSSSLCIFCAFLFSHFLRRRFFTSSFSPALECIFRLCSFDFRSFGGRCLCISHSSEFVSHHFIIRHDGLPFNACQGIRFEWKNGCILRITLHREDSFENKRMLWHHNASEIIIFTLFFAAPRPCRSLCFGAKKRYRSFSHSSLREKSFEIAEKRENNKFSKREKSVRAKKNRMSEGEGWRGRKKNICAIMPFVMVFIERRTEHASISNNFFFSCSRFIYVFKFIKI